MKNKISAKPRYTKLDELCSEYFFGERIMVCHFSSNLEYAAMLLEKMVNDLEQSEHNYNVLLTPDNIALHDGYDWDRSIMRENDDFAMSIAKFCQMALKWDILKIGN